MTIRIIGRSFSTARLGLPLILILISLLLPGTAQAQVLYGSIAGNVTDQSEGAVPGVEVTVTNQATNYTQTTVSNDLGAFLLQNVPRGTYTLRVSLSGFKEYVEEGVPVSVGAVTRRNVRLQVGEITEAITVSSEATLLQADKTDVSAQLQAEEISDLPLGQFRNYQSLLNLVPGSTPARFQNAITDTPGRALTTNINGTARNNNNTRIDGAMSVNIWLPHHTAYVPPAETIEEVNISTNNFDAEQGFAGGAAVTVVTKSGTNELRGSLFAFHENSVLNARPFFRYLDTDGDGKADPVSGRRNIDGFTIGGPIVKDKLFFFGGLEATLQSLARTQTATVPTMDLRGGNFSAANTTIYDPTTGNPDGSGRTPFANNIIPENRISPAAQRMLALLPPPNLPGRTANFERSGGERMDRYNTDIKIDYYTSDSHRMWGKFSWMDAEVKKDPVFGDAGGGAIGGGGDGVGLTDVRVYGIGHTLTVSPTFLIDGNFGFTDMDQEVVTADLDKGNFGQEVLGIPGTNSAAGQEQACNVGGANLCGGVPRFDISGYTSLGQVDNWSPLLRDENSATFTQNFSWNKGNHEVRWGYDLVKHMLDHWQPEIGSHGPRGRFVFGNNMTWSRGLSSAPIQENAFAAFLLGLPEQYGKALQWELMTANEWQHALYIRDRWQFTPKLTFTLGLRWEYYPLVSRDDRPMEFLDLNSFDVVLDNDVAVSKKLFGPRVGFAYRLSDDDVIRSGYGITYSPLPFARPLRGFYPLTVAATFDPTVNNFVPFRTLSEGINLFTGPDSSPGARIPLPSFVEQRTMPADFIRRGYIQSWNLIYERKLPGQFVGSFGYVGTQTTGQLADHNLNWSRPGQSSTPQLFPRSTTNILYWDGWLSKNYHSLQVAMNRRFVNGFFLKGAYTFSKAIDMANDEGWAGLALFNDPSLISRNRAAASYDRPHLLQLAAIYELPFAKNTDGVLGHIARGWQINTIFSANSNTPFTVTSSSPLNARANSQTADQVKSEVQELGGIGPGQPYFDRTAFAPVTRTPGQTCTYLDCYGNSGRNILRGPTWYNLDFSVFRRFDFTERTNLEFRAEFFNFTNTPKFGNPSASVTSTASFMTITGVDGNNGYGNERFIRFGLRLGW